jgi:hypothetical protein
MLAKTLKKLSQLALPAVAALALLFAQTAAAQYYSLPGGQQLTGLPGTNAYLFSFSIGGTNPTVAPVNLAGCRNISWEFKGACTNTTSAASLVFALFNDMTATDWATTVSNCTLTSLRVMTLPMTTSMQTISTNYQIDAYQWMVPLYLTNASQCLTNCALRYGIKPGF